MQPTREPCSSPKPPPSSRRPHREVRLRARMPDRDGGLASGPRRRSFASGSVSECGMPFRGAPAPALAAAAATRASPSPVLAPAPAPALEGSGDGFALRWGRLCTMPENCLD